MSRAIALDAPGKVNLVLRVLHRRPDGYRELETVFQMVSLADRVELTLSEGPGAVTLSVDGPDLGPVESNLAWRAAEEFRLAAGLDAGVHIALTKKIPAGAGLGGGSSDAAAVLRGLARLTGFDDPLRLHGIARSLGADVPFFLGPAPIALGRGRGDELTPLQARRPTSFLLFRGCTFRPSTRTGHCLTATETGTHPTPQRTRVPALTRPSWSSTGRRSYGWQRTTFSLWSRPACPRFVPRSRRCRGREPCLRCFPGAEVRPSASSRTEPLPWRRRRSSRTVTVGHSYR